MNGKELIYKEEKQLERADVDAYTRLVKAIRDLEAIKTETRLMEREPSEKATIDIDNKIEDLLKNYILAFRDLIIMLKDIKDIENIPAGNSKKIYTKFRNIVSKELLKLDKEIKAAYRVIRS